jgi:hypothetical protein
MPPKAQPQTRAQQAPSLLDRDGLISSEELAAWLDVPVGTLDQWASKGGGPLYHKVGVHHRYHPADVKEWLRDRRLAATGDPRPTESAAGTGVSDRRPVATRKGTRRRPSMRGVGADPSSAA